jgi:hypothetical protein
MGASERHRGTVSESKGSPLAVFMAECYAPASDADASAAGLDRVGAACADLRAAGAEVVYLGALLVPDEEMAFHLFVAPEAGGVEEASRRAGLRVERIVQSVAICFGKGPPARRKALAVGDQLERPVAHAPGEIGP